MKHHSNISKTEGGAHEIYGQKVTELMKQHSFVDTVFLLYTGKLPAEGERALLDTMLIASSEHGIEAPSLYVPRISVASGNSVHVGMAAGILAIGEAHGGAGEASVRVLASKESAEDIVERFNKEGKFIPGFGHKVYKDEDPRATIIYMKAKEGKVPLAAFEKAYAIEALLEKQKGKKLPLNIDGAFAAGVLALGMDPLAAKALFVFGRVAGMGAHAIEEKNQNNAYWRQEEEQETK